MVTSFEHLVLQVDPRDQILGCRIDQVADGTPESARKVTELIEKRLVGLWTPFCILELLALDSATLPNWILKAQQILLSGTLITLYCFDMMG